MTSLKDEARALLRDLDTRTFSGTAYDTAWVARVTIGSGSEDVFPEALAWLRSAQHPDGSWGGEHPYYHDRVICTLSAVLALRERGDVGEDVAAVDGGIRYLRENIGRLAEDPCETVGFELLLPSLLDQAARLGLELPYAAADHYRTLRAAKLALLPESMLRSRHTSLAHSLEALGDLVRPEHLEALQEPNGSFGLSPAATAFALSLRPDDRAARRYLSEVLRVHGGCAPSAHDVEIFNKSWILYNLDLAGLLDELREDAAPHLEYLHEHWNGDVGVGFSREYPVPDLDDTAVVFKLLRRAGYDVDPAVFRQYERDTHYACYRFERNPSLSANAHLLDALHVLPTDPERLRMTNKLVELLRRGRRPDGDWLDKWHVSPFYITSHVLLSCVDVDRRLAGEIAGSLLARQRATGGWGVHGSTCEETAYCLQALMTYHARVERIAPAPLDRAVAYLHERRAVERRPALWIEKSLYLPIHIVEATILSALWMADRWR